MSNLTDGTTPDNQTSLNVPDLSDLIGELDFDKQPLSHGLMQESNNRANFNVGKWGSLIIELIAYPTERDAILEQFGISLYQYSQLMGNPIFKAVYKDTESSIVALATNGGYQLSARRLAEQGLSVLEDIMANGDDKERIKAVELAARLANLDPLVQAKLRENNSGGSTGVQLVVNFGGGMPLPSSFQGQAKQIIDVKAESVDEIE